MFSNSCVKLHVDMYKFAYDCVKTLSHYRKVNIERCVKFLVYPGIFKLILGGLVSQCIKHSFYGRSQEKNKKND